MAAFVELWPPILAKRPPSRALATKSVSFAEGTRGQKAVSTGRLPAAAAADFAALAAEEVCFRLSACLATMLKLARHN